MRSWMVSRVACPVAPSSRDSLQAYGDIPTFAPPYVPVGPVKLR